VLDSQERQSNSAVFFEDPDGLYLEFTHTPNGYEKQLLSKAGTTSTPKA
jgi:hypothetical protein